MDVDYQAVEHELCRIPEVSAARIVGANGHPPEVHIVASGERQAQHVARDVQSVARVSFGLELDGRAISVVQVEDPGPGPAPAPAPASASAPTIAPAAATWSGGDGILRPHAVDLTERERDLRPPPRRSGRRERQPVDGSRVAVGRVAVGRVVASRTGASGSVEVELRADATTAHGLVTGTSGAAGLRRATAAATLDALRQLLPATGRADVATATIVNVGEHAIAVVIVAVVVPPHEHEETLAGAAVVRDAGPLDAVARAVLDAMNRRMTILAAD